MVLDKGPTSFFCMGISVFFFLKTVLSPFNGLGSTITRDYNNKEDDSTYRKQEIQHRKETKGNCRMIVSQFRAPLTKYRLGHLHNRNLFSHSAGHWKSTIWVPTALFSDDYSPG